jgi:hypothetical protein
MFCVATQNQWGCVSGSGRIGIIGPYPAIPYPFLPNVKLNYTFFPKNFNILSKMLKIMSSVTLTNNKKQCSGRMVLLGIKVKKIFDF